MHGFRIDPAGTEPAVVTRVDPGSPAEEAGLKVGDSIDAINGSRISSTGDAKGQMFELFLSQQPLHLTLRSGKTIDIPAVTLPDAKPAGSPGATLQRDRRRHLGLAAVVVLSLSPARRRS